jgi:LysR family transcriptional regulator, regulator for genes of the gallate degradation pathway
VPPINIRHLVAALAIERLGSVTAAAEVIHLSQSAVSQGIAKLQRTLRATLFTRTPAGMFPTGAGKGFLARARRAMDWLIALDRLAASASGPGARDVHRFLTTAELVALMAVVETGSYTRAAASLGVTQPTVHRGIRQLEGVYRRKLFRNSPRGVEPTWQARRMARHFGLYFAELEQAVSELNERRGIMGGSLSVGSLPMARTRLVPHAVTRLLQEYPQVHVRIVDGPYEEQLHALLHGQVDVIVGALRDPSPAPDIVQEALFTDHLSMVFRADHPLADAEPVQAARLADLEWIAPRPDTPAREAFVRFFQQAGLSPPERVIECSSLVAIRGLLLESDRVALLPARQVEVERRAGLLRVSRTPLAGTAREIGLAMRRHWQPTKVQTCFLDLLRAEEAPAHGGSKGKPT